MARQHTDNKKPRIKGFCWMRVGIVAGFVPSMTRAALPDRNRIDAARLASPTKSGRKPIPRPVFMPYRETPSV